MLEAVNSVLQTAPVIRGNAEQVSTAASFAANPTSVQKIPQAPYISPYIHLDVDLGAVLQIRDSDTGDVVRQIPSEASIEARQRFQQQIDLQQQQQQTRPSSESAQVIASQIAAPRPQQTQQAEPQQQQQTQQPRRQVPQAQIAAFQSASVSGGGGSSAGAAVTLFA
jgi:hypothetical protein